MKQSMRYPLLVLAGAAAALVLRLAQRATGFEADTGLPVPGSIPAAALAVWFLVLAAVCILAARAWLPADGDGSSPLFPDGFSTASAGLLTPAVMGIFLLAASGALDLVSGLGDRVPVLTGGTWPSPMYMVSSRAAPASSLQKSTSLWGFSPCCPPCASSPPCPPAGIIRPGSGSPSRARSCWCRFAAWWCGWC